jgi:hypothetical protein
VCFAYECCLYVTQMRDIWLQKIRLGEFEAKSGAPQTGQIEVVKWLSRMTLDVIGLAGEYFPC